MTWRQAIYMVLDELKGMSDDFTYTEEHTMFLLGKYRTFILKQRYADIKKQIPESNYQTICVDLTEVPVIQGKPCEGNSYLRSKEKIPYLMKIGTPRIYPINYYLGEITYVSRDRMRYVGHNKYLQNIIYASLGPDNHLYLQSSNPQFLYLEKVRLTGIFEDIESVADLECNESGDSTNCDIFDKTFPIEDALVPSIIELVVRELLGAAWRPKDQENNATDDMADLASFLQRNTKSELAKALQ